MKIVKRSSPDFLIIRKQTPALFKELHKIYNRRKGDFYNSLSSGIDSLQSNSDWKQFANDLQRIFSIHTEKVINDTLEFEKCDSLPLNILDNELISWRDKLSESLAKETTETTQKGYEVLSNSMFTKGIGLNPRSTWALINRIKYLNNHDTSLSEEGLLKINEQIDQYINKAIDNRKKRIVKTTIWETMNGVRQKYLDKLIRLGKTNKYRKEWLAEASACKVCKSLDGTIVYWNEEFARGTRFPPSHTNCFCSFQLI